MLENQADHPAIYGAKQLRRHKSEIFGLAVDLLWRVSMELQPYLAIFKVPGAVEFRYTRDLSLAELVELDRCFRREAGTKPGRIGYPGFSGVWEL